MPTSSASGLSVTTYDGLTGTRAEVLDDTGPTIPEIPIRLVFDIVLPHPPILDHVPGIFASLKTGKNPHYSGRRRRWTAFFEDPVTAELHENEVYKQLEEIYRAILGAARGLGLTDEPTTTFTNSPHYVPKGGWRNSTSKPDGFFVLRNRRAGGTPHWMDIAATGEYKRDEEEKRNLEDDSKKILWNMHQTMRDDPCRQRTFGFTIDNREMRIWYASRSDILVSKPFDFMRDPKFLIKFFLIFSFADVYSLGWDPNMVCEWRGPRRQPHYVITVRCQKTGEEAQFRATDILSNIGAEAVRGRGTRVFKVRRLENGEEVGDEMALKDCWMDVDRTGEGTILEDIMLDAKAGGSEDNIKVLEEGLLSVFMHGDAYVNGELDCTLTKERRAELFTQDDLFLVHRSDENKVRFAKLAHKNLQARAVKGSHLSKSNYIHRSSLSPIMYCPKKHYRIVFKEVCNPLYRETSLLMTFFILNKVCTVLKALHAIGWVHRDVSIGNILFMGTNVKLADVEYAKRIGKTTGGHHEIRTGTADFMSVEVYHMRYLFAPSGEKMQVTLEQPEDALNAMVPAERPAQSEINLSSVPWFYSPIHDMESVFWLIAYYVLFRDPYFPEASNHSPSFQDETPSKRVERIKAQFELAQHLFIERNQFKRFALIEVHGELKTALAGTPFHPALDQIKLCLLQARDAIHQVYENIEATLPIPLARAPSIAGDLYKEFRTILYTMRAFLASQGAKDLQSRPLAVEWDLIQAKEDAEKKKRRKATDAAEMELLRAEDDREDEEYMRTLTMRSIAIPAPIPTVVVEEQTVQPVVVGPVLRRSHRIAARVVRFEGPGGEDEQAVPDTAPRRPSGKVVKKPTGQAGSKKRKRADDGEEDNTQPRRKAKAAPAKAAQPPKPASRKSTRVATPAPLVVVTRPTRPRGSKPAKELLPPADARASDCGTATKSRKRLRDKEDVGASGRAGRVLRSRRA